MLPISRTVLPQRSFGTSLVMVLRADTHYPDFASPAREATPIGVIAGTVIYRSTWRCDYVDVIDAAP